MIIFLMPSPCNKSPPFVFLIYELPLILSTTQSCFIVFPPGSAFPLFHYNGSLHISHPSHLLVEPSTQFPFILLLPAVFHKAPFGPVIFNLYTTPLSSLISASSISQLLYADDIQLFISFVPKNCSSAINNLQSTITLISSWMSSN